MEASQNEISVAFRLGDNECVINVDPFTEISDIYPKAVIEKLGLKQEIEDLTVILDGVTMGDQEIVVGLTWEENNINDGARLEIHKRERSSFNDVVKDVIKMNPHIAIETLNSNREDIEIHSQEPWHITGDLRLESFGYKSASRKF